MSLDIFNRNTSQLAGVFAADNAKLTMANNLGVLVQQLSFGYSQAVMRLYEIGANGANNASNIYYVGGRTQGQAALNRVIGPRPTIRELYAKYGDVCKAKSNGGLSFGLKETDCSNAGAGGETKFDMKAVVIVNVSIGVEAERMLITDNTSMMYASLEMP